MRRFNVEISSILTPRSPGKFNILPKIGTLRKKFTATGKKLLWKSEKKLFIEFVNLVQSGLVTYLNSKKNPYDSIIIPMIGHPNKTITIPPKNAIDALIFCRLKKNLNVRSRPITQANPHINKIWNVVK